MPISWIGVASHLSRDQVQGPFALIKADSSYRLHHGILGIEDEQPITRDGRIGRI